MPKAFFLGAFLAIALYLGSPFEPSGVTPASATRLEPKDKQPVAELTDDMTARQLEHSRINSDEQIPEGVIRVRDLPASYPGQSDIRISISDTLVDLGDSIDERLSKMVSESDLILIGSVEGSETKVSADGYSLFSDYRVRVADVVKPDSLGRTSVGDVVTVTRRGGRARVNGVEVTTEFNRSPILDVGRKRLLLFLEYLPATDDYVCNGEASAFVVNRTGPRPISEVGPDLTTFGDLEQLKSAMRAKMVDPR